MSFQMARWHCPELRVVVVDMGWEQESSDTKDGEDNGPKEGALAQDRHYKASRFLTPNLIISET